MSTAFSFSSNSSGYPTSSILKSSHNSMHISVYWLVGQCVHTCGGWPGVTYCSAQTKPRQVKPNKAMGGWGRHSPIGLNVASNKLSWQGSPHSTKGGKVQEILSPSRGYGCGCGMQTQQETEIKLAVCIVNMATICLCLQTLFVCYVALPSPQKGQEGRYKKIM